MPTEQPESAKLHILSIFFKVYHWEEFSVSWSYEFDFVNNRGQVLQGAVGINERLDVIQAVKIAATSKEESKTEQCRFMPEQPVMAPC